MHTHVLFILSLVLLRCFTTTSTSLGRQPVAIADGAANKCIDKERQALLDFKAHLEDPEDRLVKWRPQEEDDCCKWSGVTCHSQTGHVTEIDLSYVYNEGTLGGDISLSLLNLSYMNHLDLKGNSFHGIIPRFIGSMTRITYLDLSENEFTGTIPKFIGNLTQLTYLNLGWNNLSGNIPRSIGCLTKLTTLRLGWNNFSGTITRSFGSLTKLTTLHLGLNNLTGTVPMSIGSLIKLTHLYLSRNSLCGTVHALVGNMTKLTHLYLNGNNFSGTIPMPVGNMTKLTHLYLQGNNFSGTIPRSIGSLTNLVFLDLSQNSLNGTIPPEFGSLTSLVRLSLASLRSCIVVNLDWLSPLLYLEQLELDEISLAKANNWVNVIIGLQNLSFLSLKGCDLSQVTHSYSSSVDSSSSIDTLYLDKNNLNASMYHWLCPLFGNRLEYLFLSGNTFDGKLSDFLKNLSGCTSDTLRYLDASSSQFTGSLSDEIQNFSSLAYLNLSSNQLDGTISDTLWKLPRIKEVDLSSNALKGSISKNIGKSNLLYIDLSNNSLEGVPFNADMSNLSMNLEYIDFSSCKIGPLFPKWIQKMEKLIHLDLSNNSISDTLSIEYWNQWRLSRLNYINLSFNNITGRIPNSLSSLYLFSVDLRSNNFYGPMPTFPVSTSFLDLSGNKFQGGISSLCQTHANLVFVDLSRNLLTGKLPDCLRNLTKLTVLNLGHNFLSGSLPPSLGYLDQLKMLCLYNNSFSGALALSLRNCTKLSLLDLGANLFFGNVPVWIGENLSGLYYLSLRSNNFYGTIPLQLCQLVTLQILDLSMNNLQGTIPSCVNNFTTMVQEGFFVKQNVHHYSWSADEVSSRDSFYTLDHINDNYVDHAMIEWQGKINEFSSTLGLVKTIDLSSNNLTGKIPDELTNLYGLLVLDLSHNALVGKIPQDIGQMKDLLTLNLSRNMVSGEIPSTMSKMDRLNDLDVSYNNLSGKIPSSTQLQSFPPERFAGNARLCGLPTTKKCLRDDDVGLPSAGESVGDGESTREFWRWLYIGAATGFATAFWIACSALVLNRRLRHAFFHFHTCLKDWVYVKVAVFIAKLQRLARA